jgi:hypothetical protein
MLTRRSPHLSGATVDAIQLLTDQHSLIEERLDSALAAKDPREQAALAAEAGDHLAVHIAAEEQVFHPALNARGDAGIRPELLDQHRALKRLLADLLELTADDPSYRARLEALREQTADHHREEEGRLFPRVRRCIEPGELELLGREMLACQKRLLREGQPREAVAEQIERAAAA